jgi:UDP-N-acetyl-D-galactosamine dehydrogenase
MSNYVVSTLEENFIKKNIELKTSKILILGLTFKENCPDLRNSKVLDIVDNLFNMGAKVDSFDPWVDLKPKNVSQHFKTFKEIELNQYDGIIVAVAHDKFVKLEIQEIRNFMQA